jgi:hypothetical protein
MTLHKDYDDDDDDTSECRQYKEYGEYMDHLTSACPILARNEYISHHAINKELKQQKTGTHTYVRRYMNMEM